jgi:hypothetical protein
MGKMGSFNPKQTSVNGLPKAIHKQTSVLSEMSDFNGQGFMWRVKYRLLLVPFQSFEW